MKIIDTRRELRQLYACPAGGVAELDMPRMSFLMADGMGDPAVSRDFQESVQALYSLSYTLKFTLKKLKVADFKVAPLEGLWWADDMSVFLQAKREHWRWTLMIMQPELVTAEFVAQAREEVRRKGKESAIGAGVRFEEFHEGLSAQLLHIGPCATEGPTIQTLHRHIAERGGRLRGKHHEIYLSDPRRAAPQRMKTIIRQPFEP